MIAFVTGGTGFVGSNLCERLRREGWTVRALVREGSNAHVLESVGCERIIGDLFTADAVRRGCDGADVIFHLAGVTSAVNRSTFDRVNGHGVRTVLASAHRAAFRGRFVLLSSLAAAGPSHGGEPRRADDPLRPVSHYGASKRLGERLLWERHGAIPVTVLRPGAIYGPREHEIFKVLKPLARTGIAAIAGPDALIQMTHVDDVVDALIRVATAPAAINRAYMVNDTQAWRVSATMRLMGEALGRPVRFIRLPAAVGWLVGSALDTAGRIAGRPLSPFGTDKMREIAAGSWLGDSAPLTADTGWRARWSLPEGLRQTIAWYRSEGWL